MSSLRYLLLVCLMGPLGFGSLHGMQVPRVDDFVASPAFQDLVTRLMAEWLDAQKGKGFKWAEEQRKEYAAGLLGKLYAILDKAIGRKAFPITGDAELGESFSLQEWAMACTQGNVKVIEHFLANGDYAHLLNDSDGDNKALSWAAFGYLNGEKFGDVVPTIEGFKLLVRDKRIDSKFLIRAGLGRIPFDEWLLHEAAYPNDAKAQARLEALQGLLEPTLSPERLDAIQEIRERKESKRRDQEKKDAELRKSRFNMLSFVVGGAVTIGALYYYLHRHAAVPEKLPTANLAKTF